MTPALVPASRAHIGRIASRMREWDRRELAAKGRCPKTALRLSLASSQFAFTAMVNGSPHAMLGVCPYNLAEGVGRPWMLGTDEIYRNGRALIAIGPDIVELMHDSFSRLENVVAAENLRAVALLKRWGFQVAETGEMVGGVEFVTFWRGR